jgi:hypothetical protein
LEVLRYFTQEVVEEMILQVELVAEELALLLQLQEQQTEAVAVAQVVMVEVVQVA